MAILLVEIPKMVTVGSPEEDVSCETPKDGSYRDVRLTTEEL